MKLKVLITSILIGLALVGKSQQDAQYSQYMFNGIYINPAYAGYKEQLNLHSFYRNQWTGIKGAPKSASLAIDAIANDGNVGLAFQLASDKLGPQSTIAAYGSYAYRIRMSSSDESARLALGLGVGVVQNTLNGNMLEAIDPNDPRATMGIERNLLPDARTGVFYSDDRWYAGVSVDNLIAHYLDKNKGNMVMFPMQKPHYYLTAGMLLPINETVQLKPSFLLKDDRGGPTSLDVNAFVLLADRIWLGGSYRTAVSLYDKSYLQKDLVKANSIVAMTEFFATPQLRIGYAYDYAMSSLRGTTGGTHEISVGFYIKPKNIRMMSQRYF
ncbi:MAG: type IX secretion system membrane protein PorP/SprF [Pedobacter sp.]|uniref:PorP/SprF family type IX secretion system membrane protein n=1 Tax=Pedobacter sp. TaxID=1411316 RepID=UPI002807D894|nr:type IX secretion system membrane protein PorP/SprF [Pedobacter sp.]MDQ8006025.1 type IX secretion system membrane protein PorP/SprF [Pedobacter sp.]